MAAPSTFLPGRTPHRYRPDPRATSKWRRLRKNVLTRDHFACRRCGAAATDVDHRVELIDGGEPFDPSNLQALCAACHDMKSTESRYLRASRATLSWGRMALCPRCAGSGWCGGCVSLRHPCTVCLGVRFIPERDAQRGEIPSQSVVAEVSPLAWAGAKPTPT
ncbi:MAG: HNH endonuclease [Thermoplasmata archaeon]